MSPAILNYIALSGEDSTDPQCPDHDDFNASYCWNALGYGQGTIAEYPDTYGQNVTDAYVEENDLNGIR